ncbi:hypothetical protein [Amycolatopsis jiangsuensis]|uniref:Uncharacterized protein n=1 Tax=Amycolatopsis jiangsuensis TaxID=1181879 RepID=A0A840ISZ1_9PSEU|nr:hypothetical protein [Amycolatopsis jiangsuensis]MBB4685741.1 hypothetical protein [Amycolatopsis jiangsuensis]
MQVYDIVVPGGDELKESIARELCPDENHAPPCPVPWSLSSAENGLLLTVCADQSTAEDVARRVGGRLPVLADPDDYPELIEQYRIERESRK